MGLFDVDFDLNFDPSQFANELVAGAPDIDEASKAALIAVFAKPEVKQRLKNGVALRSEAQRSMDKARGVATEAERIRDANFQWAEQNRKPIEQWLATQGSQTATVTAPSGDVLTRSDVEKLMGDMKKQFSDTLAAQDESYVGLIADTVELTQRYSQLFDGASLPYGDLQKFALEKRTTLRNAFDTFIAPKLEEKRKAETEKLIAAAREEGRLEALSQREEQSVGEAAGGDLGSAFKDVLLGRRTQTLKDASGKELEGENAFVARWQATGGFTRPEKVH